MIRTFSMADFGELVRLLKCSKESMRWVKRGRSVSAKLSRGASIGVKEVASLGKAEEEWDSLSKNLASICEEAKRLKKDIGTRNPFKAAILGLSEHKK